MALALSGCGVPAREQGVRPLTPGAVAADQSLPGSSAAQWPQDRWWAAYGDSQLDALVAEGLANSPDVAAAGARFRKAAALAQQAGAALQPRVDVAAEAGLQKQSINMGYPPQFQQFLPRGWNDAGRVSASLGFDLDLWGRNRAQLAAATSEREATAIDGQQAALALAGGIASAYADLDMLFAARDVRASELDAAVKWQKLLSDRQVQGLETRGAVAQGEARSATARAALAQADEALLLRRHQIAALVGAGPDRGLAITRPRLAAVEARGLPAGLTTELLGRRPDIVAARERVEAAGSRIKVARADFFPAIRLDALFGVQSLGLGVLFDKDSTMGSVGPAISLPIFHGGELRGRYRAAEADYDLAVAGYNSTVLGAYQQTADAWTSATLSVRRLAEARAALNGAQEAYDVALKRYTAGLSNYLAVLQVEDALLDAKMNVAGLEANARAADIALVRALGGGFVPPASANSGNPTNG